MFYPYQRAHADLLFFVVGDVFGLVAGLLFSVLRQGSLASVRAFCFSVYIVAITECLP